MLKYCSFVFFDNTLKILTTSEMKDLLYFTPTFLFICLHAYSKKWVCNVIESECRVGIDYEGQK